MVEDLDAGKSSKSQTKSHRANKIAHLSFEESAATGVGYQRW